MDIHFILWIIIQYYLIFFLKLSQLWPLGALSINTDAPFTYHLLCWLKFFKIVLSKFLLSGTTRCFRLIPHMCFALVETICSR